MNNLLVLLKRFFGYTSFRPQQKEIIANILQGRDSLVLMPTGGGKSLCYQLPGIYLPGTTIVVSPLIALMKDQVEGLIANGIPAAALNSSVPEEERSQICQLCIQGKIKLLYISPEKLMSELNWLLPRLDISLIAIDEAHCISHWGHDFRPEYTQLSVLKEHFPRTPIIALTATADKVTRNDIIEQLKLTHPAIFITSFDRPNLSLNVRHGLNKKEKTTAIINFIKRHPRQSGIIYCLSRSSTEELAKTLSGCRIPALAYHAGMDADSREKVQNYFIKDQINVICATVAFGMGIDKSNVRWVIHYNMPGSIESYYQEIGRAGRDGLKSDTLLFYSVSDLLILRKFAEESGQIETNLQKLESMRRYCEANVCRRRILLSYFGEEIDHDCHNCDICKNPPLRFDGSELVQKALSGICRTEQSVTMHLLIQLLQGKYVREIQEKGYHQIKTFGVGKDLSFKQWKEYLYQMLQLGYIEIDYAHKGVLLMTPLGRKVLYGEQKAILAVYKEDSEETETSTKKFTYRPIRPRQSSSVDYTLQNALQQLRKQIADREGIPPYHIFSDKTLDELVQKRPITLEDFSEIYGVGEVKLHKYGRVFVSLIRFILKFPKL